MVLPKPYYETELGRLYHGDCLEIMPHLEPVDLVLTDPPYLDGNKSFLLNFYKKVVVTPGKHEVFNWIIKRVPEYQYAWKCSGTKSLGGKYCFHILFEPILAYCPPIKPLGSDLLDFPLVVDKMANGHPWPKPYGLMAKLLVHWSLESWIIVDPFLGSGTTAIACERLNRQWIGIEIEEKYCEIAAKRIENERKQLKLF